MVNFAFCCVVVDAWDWLFDGPEVWWLYFLLFPDLQFHELLQLFPAALALLHLHPEPGHFFLQLPNILALLPNLPIQLRINILDSLITTTAIVLALMHNIL